MTLIGFVSENPYTLLTVLAPFAATGAYNTMHRLGNDSFNAANTHPKTAAMMWIALQTSVLFILAVGLLLFPTMVAKNTFSWTYVPILVAVGFLIGSWFTVKTCYDYRTEAYSQEVKDLGADLKSARTSLAEYKSGYERVVTENEALRREVEVLTNAHREAVGIPTIGKV